MMPFDSIKIVRTTLTLDDDVYAKLECEASREGKSFEETVNHFLRLGLTTRQQYGPRQKVTVRSRAMGLRDGLSLASVARLIEEIEGPMQ